MSVTILCERELVDVSESEDSDAEQEAKDNQPSKQFGKLLSSLPHYPFLSTRGKGSTTPVPKATPKRTRARKASEPDTTSKKTSAVAATSKKKRSRSQVQEEKEKKREEKRQKRIEEQKLLMDERERNKPGEDCSFRHEGTPSRKGELCKFFITEACVKGMDCIFSHDTKHFPCRHFHFSSKGCRELEKCRFSHEPISEEARKAYWDEFSKSQPGAAASTSVVGDTAAVSSSESTSCAAVVSFGSIFDAALGSIHDSAGGQSE